MEETRKEIIARLQKIAMREFTERTEPEARDAVREVCEALFAEGCTLSLLLNGITRWRATWEDLAPDISFFIGSKKGGRIHSLNVGRVQEDTGLRHNVGTFYVNWAGGKDAVMILCPRTLAILRACDPPPSFVSHNSKG